MQEPPSRRSSAIGAPGFALLMLLLGLAVFCWGLHYKISLYDAPAHSSAPQVAAKLLSQQERTEPQARQLVNVEPTLLPAFFALVLFASFPVLSGAMLIGHRPPPVVSPKSSKRHVEGPSQAPSTRYSSIVLIP